MKARVNGMPKMTTEQFVKILGIELEQEFKWNGTDIKYRISKCYEVELFSTYKNAWVESASNIKDLLGFEITPLPKYTLTDDEKAIVRCLSKDFKWIVRDKVYGLFLCTEKPFKLSPQSIDWSSGGGDYRYITVFENVFNFIQWENEEPVSLDELRKCL